MSVTIKLFIVSIFVICILSGLAQADDVMSPRRIVFYDPAYSVHWCSDPREATRFFEARGFEKMNAEALAAWMEQAIEDGTAAGTVVLNFTGVTPRLITEPFDEQALLYRYCAAGGRAVMGAGNVLNYIQGDQDIRLHHQYFQDQMPVNMIGTFGIKPVYGMTGDGLHVTEEGKKWGLEDADWIKTTGRGGSVPAKQVTHVLIGSESGEEAAAWQVNLDPSHPHSGLIGLAAYWASPDNIYTLEALYKLAMFDGRPVTEIPDVQWRSVEKAPAVIVNVSMKPGSVERRAYQRDETIPLHLSISGPQYAGQGVALSLRQESDVLWTRLYEGNGDLLEITDTLDTTDLRSGEYVLDVQLDGQSEPVYRETLWVSSPRPNNAYMLALNKGIDANLSREEGISRWLRDHNLNFHYYDAKKVNQKSEQELLARYLDQLIRFNLIGNASLSCMPLLTVPDRPQDALVLPDGKKVYEGKLAVISSRTLANDHADLIRDGHREQAKILHDMQSPVLRPHMMTNDDSSYFGWLDFSDLTIRDFERKTGISWSDVPTPISVSDRDASSADYYRGDHPEGIVSDDDPWLAYMRYHVGKYETILDLTMQGVQEGWPGALVGELPCMSGPAFFERSQYPPIHGRPLNTASFYMYHPVPDFYTFSVEYTRMNNRGKPGLFMISSSYLTWGGVFQRQMMYHILAENPRAVMLFRLENAPVPSLLYREREQYEAIGEVGGKMTHVAELLKEAQVPIRKAALFIGFAQNAFHPKQQDRDQQSAAFANLLRTGADIELVSEEEIRDGKASRYEVIVLNGIRWMQESTRQALEQYITQGGKVILDANTTIPIQSAIQIDEPIATHASDRANPRSLDLCKRLVGRLVPAMESVRTTDLDTVIRPLVNGDQLLVWVLDVESSEQAAEIAEARSRDWTSGIYDLLAEWEAQTPIVQKSLRVAKGLYAYDLWNHREVPLSSNGKWSTGTVETQLLSGTLLALYPQRVGDLIVKTTVPETKPGQKVSIDFILESDQHQVFKGIVPVEVRVFYPDGTEAWEYGQDTLMIDGRMNVNLTVARNDPMGEWRVTVRELCSGRHVDAVVQVIP